MINQKWRTSSRFFKAFTLVEVVAGLALLGTLLVSLLLIKAGVTRQLATTDRRLAAVAACDRLLSNLETGGRPLPRNGGGITSDGMRWQSKLIRQQFVQNISLDVIRLSVTGDQDDRILAQVEIFQNPLERSK